MNIPFLGDGFGGLKIAGFELKISLITQNQFYTKLWSGGITRSGNWFIKLRIELAIDYSCFQPNILRSVGCFRIRRFCIRLTPSPNATVKRNFLSVNEVKEFLAKKTLKSLGAD